MENTTSEANIVVSRQRFLQPATKPMTRLLKRSSCDSNESGFVRCAGQPCPLCDVRTDAVARADPLLANGGALKPSPTVYD